MVITAEMCIKLPEISGALVRDENGEVIGRVVLLDTDRHLAYQQTPDGDVVCIEGVSVELQEIDHGSFFGHGSH